MLTELIRTLKGRAEQCRGNAGAYESSGYHAEAVVQRAKAIAFELAAEDAERAEREARATAPAPEELT